MAIPLGSWESGGSVPNDNYKPSQDLGEPSPKRSYRDINQQIKKSLLLYKIGKSYLTFSGISLLAKAG